MAWWLVARAPRIAILLLLAGVLCRCGGDNPPPPPPPPPPSGITLGPDAAWAALYGWTPPAITRGTFAFPRCNVIGACSVNYVQVVIPPTNISAASAFSLTYTIRGNAPVFDYRTCGPGQACDPNTCGPGTPATVSLIIQSNPNLNDVYGRWFSHPPASVRDLVLGENQNLTVNLHDIALWHSVYGEQNGTTFQNALTHVVLIGFGFGGGCFSAHGAYVTDGDAEFSIVELKVQ